VKKAEKLIYIYTLLRAGYVCQVIRAHPLPYLEMFLRNVSVVTTQKGYVENLNCVRAPPTDTYMPDIYMRLAISAAALAKSQSGAPMR